MLTNTNRKDNTCITLQLHCLWRWMASDLMALGLVSLICTGTSIFGGLVSTPPLPLPSQNSGDPLHITIWLTLSNVPAVQASFTSDTDGEPRGAAAWPRRKVCISQSRRKGPGPGLGPGPGPAISRHLTGSLNSTSWILLASWQSPSF